jgi:DNA polymerase III delta subunit
VADVAITLSDHFGHAGEAMAMGDAGTALKSLHALLEQGQSAILLLHGLVNFFNQMLVMSEFIASLPHGTASGNLRFDAFERQVLPGFKAFFQDNPLEFLQKVPPYGLYKAYLHAFRYDRNRLLSILPELLEADLAIKGEWSTKPEIPLERLVLLGMGNGH